MLSFEVLHMIYLFCECYSGMCAAHILMACVFDLDRSLDTSFETACHLTRVNLYLGFGFHVYCC